MSSSESSHLVTIHDARKEYATADVDTKCLKYLVVSGGTGCNAICSAFVDACYVLPISDDGGSSSEIIRVLGGPSIGDIRSRLIRLIPDAPEGSAENAIHGLLAHRFPSHYSETEAKNEWRDILEGHSSLWDNIPGDRKEAIRSFLVYFENEVLRRAQKNFSFVNGSIGNYFLAATQMFFRSLPSAIFLFSSITKSQANILPVIVTNNSVTLAAELENKDYVFGQCEISHPVRLTPPSAGPHMFRARRDTFDYTDGIVSHKADKGNIGFHASAKKETPSLLARIARIFYVDNLGQEIDPAPNREYITNLGKYDVLVYSCGSLWTSVMPTLALKGVADAIANSTSLRAKVFLLNAVNDRETEGYTAVDYVQAVVRSLNARRGHSSTIKERPASAYITYLVYIGGSNVFVDEVELKSMGVECVRVHSKRPYFNAEVVRSALDEILHKPDAGSNVFIKP